MAMSEPTLFRLEVKKTNKNREYWTTREWLETHHRADIRAADIIILPWENFREGQSALFPQGTTAVVQHLKRHLPERKVAIAIERDQYKEIALHAREWRFPALLLSIVLLPALSDVIATQLNDWISSPQEDDKVHMEVIVESENGRCISIKYEGPPDKLAQTLVEQASRCLPSARGTSSIDGDK